MTFWSKIKNIFSKDGRKQTPDSGGEKDNEKWKEETCSTEQSIQSTPTCDQSSNHSSSPPSSQSSSSSQPDTKKQYIHQKTLAEEVKMMRSLHPDVASSDRHEFLSTSSREWRKKCADALGYSDHSHSFGGSFREQIYLSTLPSCCFEELLSVFEAYDNGVIRTNRATSGLKPGLFASLVGERREVEVHLLFTSLAAGRLTLEAFRKKAKTLRSSRSEENDVQKLRMENARLRLEVARLNNLLKTLRQTTQTEKDTYAFDGNVTETTEEAIVHVTAGPADDSEENSVLDTAIEENITVVPESPMSSQESVQNDKENQNPKDATASSSAVCGKEQERRLDVQRKREKIATPVPISLNTIEKGAVLHAFYSPDKKWYKATVLGKRKSPPVEKKPRAYEEVDLPNDEDAVDPQAQYKVVKQPRSYEEVTIGDGPDEKPRLSSKPAGGQLNYVEVEFTKDKKKNSKKKKKDKDIKHSAPKPTVEYTEVTVQDSSIYINK